MENKINDDSPLSKLRNLKSIMYPVTDSDGNTVGYDYGIDIESLEGIFPWMVQKDNLGRKFLNKDSLIHFLIACMLEQDRDIDALYRIFKTSNNFQDWDPDKN
jgi:hypothetical protein